jgi:hypothetical protein
MQDFPESDWKVFRELRERALERFCKRVLEEMELIRADESRSHHSRYLSVYRLLRDRDRQLADAFNAPRRSRMIVQLVAMVACGSLEPDELRKFSPSTRSAVQCFSVALEPRQKRLSGGALSEPLRVDKTCVVLATGTPVCPQNLIRVEIETAANRLTVRPDVPKVFVYELQRQVEGQVNGRLRYV